MLVYSSLCSISTKTINTLQRCHSTLTGSIFLTGYDNINLQTSKDSKILGFIQNSRRKELEVGDYVFIYNFDKDHRKIESLFRIISKSDDTGLIWKDEKESNKIIYKNRWNAEVIADGLNISRNELAVLPPFNNDLNRFHLTIRNPFPNYLDERFDELRSLLEKHIPTTTVSSLTPSTDNTNSNPKQYFLIQVNEKGSRNLLENKTYAHVDWENTPKDSAHGQVQNGDLLIVYFARNSIQFKQLLRKVYVVDSVSPDKVTFYVSEFKNLRGISLDKIRKARNDNKLSENFDRLGQQGFNIRKVLQSDYENILLLDDEEDIDHTLGNDSDLPIPSKQQLEIAVSEIKNELFIDDSTIKEIVYNLLSGRNILLAGPIGTGKTHIAQLIPEKVWKNHDGGYYPEVVTATSDWTTTEVMGGISPTINKSEISYDFVDGCVTRTVKDNWTDESCKLRKKYVKEETGEMFRGVWLVIDEFNRANIDKCFGEMFTSLEYRELILPRRELVNIPKDYRIIATLNVFDKHFLFNMSDALKRRFAYIEISSNFMSPSFNVEGEKYYVLKRAFDEIRNNTNLEESHLIKLAIDFDHKQKVIDRDKTDKGLLKTIDESYDIFKFIRYTKNLGTGILISIIKFVLFGSIFYDEDKTKLLDSALKSNIVPQVESLQKSSLETISSFCSGQVGELFSSKKLEDIDFETYETEFRKICNHFGEKQELRNLVQNVQKQNADWSKFNPWTHESAPNLPQFIGELSYVIQNSTGV